MLPWTSSVGPSPRQLSGTTARIAVVRVPAAGTLAAGVLAHDLNSHGPIVPGAAGVPRVVDDVVVLDDAAVPLNGELDAHVPVLLQASRP